MSKNENSKIVQIPGGAADAGPAVKMCPFMSGVELVPGSMPGQVLPAGAVNLQVINTQSKCLEAQCPLWRTADKECSILTIAGALSILANVESQRFDEEMTE